MTRYSYLLVDLPLALLFMIFCTVVLIQRVHLDYVVPIIEGYRREKSFDALDADTFYKSLENDFTYYARQCESSEIPSTKDSNDLIIHESFTAEESTNVMLKHGSILLKNVLSNETIIPLRSYIESRNKIKDSLSWNENFYNQDGRLSLGLGANDDPTIAQALQEIGNHEVVKETLEALLGPDPAIVEISTLTCFDGAEDQEIHTDTDYSGSSLLYSRTFLSSYSFFIALQDTPASMGATTVCPGSHYCANDDLEEICLESSFEVSSNGHTGDNGSLLQGDALLFNQNIWHRGSSNVSGKDRIMFILTFVPRTEMGAHGDRRQLGLGTFYYQRWSMWGHTLNDLKYASTKMIQPLAFLRSLGLWKPETSNWGMTWVEHFSRQVANREDFYNNGHLRQFVKFFDNKSLPTFLREVISFEEDVEISIYENYVELLIEKVEPFFVKFTGVRNSESFTEWERFIIFTQLRWVIISSLLNLIVLSGYFVSWFVLGVLMYKKGKQKKILPPGIVRMSWTYAMLGIFYYCIFSFISSTELAQYAKKGGRSIRPYPDKLTENLLLLQHIENPPKSPTTLPEPHDILISTRFDTDFLGSFNRLVDFHPGNIEFKSMIESFSLLPESIRDANIIVNTLTVREKHEGVSPRFLWQNPEDGHWVVMSKVDAIRETRRQLLMAKNTEIKVLNEVLANFAADSRFGVMRDTSMSRIFSPLFRNKWEALIFKESPRIRKTVSSLPSKACRVSQAETDGVLATAHLKLWLPSHDITHSPIRRYEAGHAEIETSCRSNMGVVDIIYKTPQRGDKVLVEESPDRWTEAVIVQNEGKSFLVQYLYQDDDDDDDEFAVELVTARRIHRYLPLAENDFVFVHGEDKKFKGIIRMVHPDGTLDISILGVRKKMKNAYRSYVSKAISEN